MSLDIDSLKKIVKSLDAFISEYQDKVSEQNADSVIKDFQQNWKEVIPYRYLDDPAEEPLGVKYGRALLLYSAAVCHLDKISDRDINIMSTYIEEFNKCDETKYCFSLKASLFGNLGLCWHRLDEEEKAIIAFKNHLYYLLLPSSHTSYSLIAYKYRPYTDFLIKSLEDETIGLTSPITFNDPFDCPIIELLNNDDKVSGLIRQAYNDCLKIACFSSNFKLPYPDHENGEVIQEEKQKGGMPEYCNELMWAHYANCHQGVCIKYHFPCSLTQPDRGKDGVLCYFKDVIYSSQDLLQYSERDSINLYDAFFLKGEKWKYENELRFLYFDIEGRHGFHSISAKNCIEAVYFGLKCPQDHRDKVREILKDRIHEKIDLDGSRTRYPIKFYEMVIDKQHFGQVEARELPPFLGSKKLSIIKRICLFLRRILSCIVR
jgi:hypothetical protein